MDDAVKRVREHPLRPFVSRTGTWTARRATELLLDRSLDLKARRASDGMEATPASQQGCTLR